MKNNKEIMKMCECAIFVGLAIVIDIIMKAIPLFNMPNGGHVTLCGLILAIMSFRNGFKYGIIGCFVYATVDLLIAPYSTSMVSIILDYYVAFGIFSICGLFKKVFNKINVLNIIVFLTCLIICHSIRFVSSTISGILVWDTKLGASIAYNAPYVFVSLAVSVVVGLMIFPLLNKFSKDKEIE